MSTDKETDPRNQQVVDTLRGNVESLKTDYDAVQDENYRLVKKVNVLKDENDNKDTQIRRLNSKVSELKEELLKIKNSRQKEKELLFHRKSEVVKALKMAAQVYRSMNLLANNVCSCLEKMLTKLGEGSELNVCEFMEDDILRMSPQARLKDALENLTVMGKNYKESEKVFEGPKPIDTFINALRDSSVQELYDQVLKGAKIEKQEGENDHKNLKHVLKLNLNKIKEQRSKSHMPKKGIKQSDDEDGSQDSESSFAKSLDLEIPETSSIECDPKEKAEEEEDALSNAKMMLKLKYEAKRAKTSPTNHGSQEVAQPDLLIQILNDFVAAYQKQRLNLRQCSQLIKSTNNVQERVRQTIMLNSLEIQVVWSNRER